VLGLLSTTKIDRQGLVTAKQGVNLVSLGRHEAFQQPASALRSQGRSLNATVARFGSEAACALVKADHIQNHAPNLTVLPLRIRASFRPT
jgi:hypothetical protein